MKKNILGIAGIVILQLLFYPAFSQYSWSDYDYQLNFELDSKTGTYRPAYTHKSSAGNSTIWLDGANKKTGTTNGNSKGDEQKYFLQFDLPRGWSVDKNVERARASCSDSTSFSVYKSRMFSGTDRKKDVITEWNKRLKNRFGEITEPDITEGDFHGAGKFYMIIKPSGSAGAALIVIYDHNRVVPIVLDFPTLATFKANRVLMKDFLMSVKLLQGKTDMSGKKSDK